jgi:hypothetical protein
MRLITWPAGFEKKKKYSLHFYFIDVRKTSSIVSTIIKTERREYHLLQQELVQISSAQRRIPTSSLFD